MAGKDYYELVRHEVVAILKSERQRKGLSNYAVSQQSGVSESMLSLVERGHRNPTMELMLKVADGIGVSLPTVIDKAVKTVTSQKAARKSQKPVTANKLS